MLLQTTVSTPLPFPPPPLSHSLHSSGSLKIRPKKLSLQCYGVPALKNLTTYEVFPSFQIFQKEVAMESAVSTKFDKCLNNLLITDNLNVKKSLIMVSACLLGQTSWLISAQVAYASELTRGNAVYEIGELFELGIQLSYLLLLLGLLGAGTFFVIRQVLVRRELDLSAKELQVSLSSFYMPSFHL
ncbi:hypothetical protein SLEP1_g20595 [Rubroshorea leprosula]|uniref:Uncharacterized protein n=1 Tax=Rubroshorea leprosula TaxID=152421 RepID=A0AAV5J377_9ROSI|nr:hypothetical protein SLEP1_g20595 [Rubroshorea leprosula]